MRVLWRRWLGKWALGWMVCTPFNEMFIISRNWLALGGAALQGQMSKHQNTEHKSLGEYAGGGGQIEEDNVVIGWGMESTL